MLEGREKGKKMREFYERAGMVFKLLKKEGPKSQSELVKALCPEPKDKKEKEMWRGRVREALDLLETMTLVEELRDGRYATYDYEELEERVRRVLEGWWERFESKAYEEPLSLGVLMHKLGEDYEDPSARAKVRGVALKLGWIPPKISSRLVKHSRRELRAAVEGWVKHLEPLWPHDLHGLEDLEGLGLLDIYRGEVWMPSPREPEVANYDLLVQHLESGCPKLLEEWRQIHEEASRFLSLAEAVARDLLEGVKEEARRLAIPLDRDVGGSSGSEPRVYERNCVLLIYRALGGDVVLDPQRDIKVAPQRRENKDFYVVEPGPCAVTDDEGKAGEFAEFLRREVASKDGKLKVDEVRAEKHKLRQKIEEFKGQLRDIMAKIDEGLYLKGWCKKCEWLQQPLGPKA
jgi:hypothetical protein